MHTTNTPGVRSVVTVDGRERSLITLGAASSPEPRPLILVFHGSRQTAEAHRRFTGDALEPLAARGGAVVAYLDGYRGNRNDARRESFFPARRDGIDDVAFARAVVDALADSHGIDRSRVVAVGYSNGGQMVMRLLHEAPELVDAAIIIAATLPAPESFLLPIEAPTARPVPVAVVHGTHDRIVPVDGGTMKRWARAVFKVGGRTLSASGTARHFAARNGVTEAPHVEVLPSRSGPKTSVTRAAYRSDGRPPVTLYTVEGGGHTIPGPTAAPRMLGRTTDDVRLIDLVADSLREIGVAKRS